MTVSLNGQTVKNSEQSAAEIERKAAILANQWNKKSIKSAVELYEESSFVWREVKQFDKAANSLQEAGRLLLILGDNESAIKILNRSFKVAESHRSTVEMAKTQSLISLALQKTSNMKGSKKHLDKALNLSRKTSEKSAQALAYFASAEYHYLRHEYDNALNFYIQSVELWKELGNQQNYGEACIYTAYNYFAIADLGRALDYAKEAENTFLLINNQRGISLSQIAIGHILSSLNQKQTALEYYFKASRNFPEDLDLPEKGALFNGLGAIYENYGDYQLSLNYRLKALKVFKQNGYLEGQLSSMHSVIGLNYRLNKISEAESFTREAERLSKIVNDNYFITLVYREIGDNYFAQKQDEKALDFYFQSLKNTRGLISKTNYILINNKLGRIFARNNQPALAKKHFESALSTSVRVKNYFAQADTYYYLAQLEKSFNNKEKSLEYAKKSVEITETLYSNVTNSNLKSAYFSKFFDRYELYINLLMKMRQQSPDENLTLQALQTAEQSRARSMLENLSLSETNFTKDADPETIKREKEIRILLNIKADKLTDLLSENAEKSETEKIGSEIKELEHELEEIKARLKQQSPIYSAIKNPAPFDVAEFQTQILDENSLLLEFSFGAEESYLWVVSKTRVNSYILPPREQIEAKIQTLRRLLAARQIIKGEEIEAYQSRIVQAENEYWQTAKQLSDELFGQVADQFEKKRLIIVPDGKLSYFPVSALPMPNLETNEPILLSNEVVYEPSASILTVLAKNQNQTSATKNLLVFSDPVFTEEDSRFSAKNTGENSDAETALLENFRFVESLNSLSRLPASKTEADSIINIFGHSNADNYSGFTANREQLLNTEMADYKIVHFATHGLINEERPELSGIVLSRFNENGQKLDEFVRLHDIYGMNLNSDLVVLSACETGVGKEVRGEGLQSLNNAFLQVGAKTVMSSLWKVEDNATLELMKNFYHGLADENLTPSKALQKAQIKMWQSGRYQSPFYWAAFTVQGDFRRTPDFATDFPFTIIFSAAGLAVLGFGILGIYGIKRGKLKLLHRK